MLYREYGMQSVVGTVLDVRIRAPVFAGDKVTAKGRARTSAESGDGRLVSLDVWCENQRGEHVITGTAECHVRSSG
jgi:acyl dehydratase